MERYREGMRAGRTRGKRVVMGQCLFPAAIGFRDSDGDTDDDGNDDDCIGG